MSGFRFLVLVLAAALAPVPAPAQTVWSADGKIFFCDANGRTRQLTHSTRDDAPAVSPDGKRVAFVRTVPGAKIWTALDDADPQEIWIMDIDGRRQRRLISSIRNPDHASNRANLFDLKFSNTGRELFFVSGCAAVSGCVHKVDVRTRATRMLGGCNGYEVLRGGRYAGYLLVQQHRYYPEGGSFEEVWLMRADGRLVRDVGPGDQAFDETVQRFKMATGAPGNKPVQPTRACGPRG